MNKLKVIDQSSYNLVVDIYSDSNEQKLLDIQIFDHQHLENIDLPISC